MKNRVLWYEKMLDELPHTYTQCQERKEREQKAHTRKSVYIKNKRRYSAKENNKEKRWTRKQLNRTTHDKNVNRCICVNHW